MTGSKASPGGASVSTPEEKQAVRGMARAIAEMRRRGFGWLEGAIAILIVVVLLASFFTSWYVIGELTRQEDRDRSAKEERAETARIASDVRDLLVELRAAISRGPAASKAAIDELSRRFEAAQREQTAIIVRDQRAARPQTVVVYVTPSPQPTATVTCDPTPIVSNRPCRRGG